MNEDEILLSDSQQGALLLLLDEVDGKGWIHHAATASALSKRGLVTLGEHVYVLGTRGRLTKAGTQCAETLKARGGNDAPGSGD